MGNKSTNGHLVAINPELHTSSSIHNHFFICSIHSHCFTHSNVSLPVQDHRQTKKRLQDRWQLLSVQNCCQKLVVDATPRQERFDHFGNLWTQSVYIEQLVCHGLIQPSNCHCNFFPEQKLQPKWLQRIELTFLQVGQWKPRFCVACWVCVCLCYSDHTPMRKL